MVVFSQCPQANLPQEIGEEILSLSRRPYPQGTLSPSLNLLRPT